MCLSLAACGSSGQPGTANTKKDQEPTPEYVYTAEYKDLTQNRENYLNICAMTADGMYATSNEKIGENIPEGVTPEYEGQYDVYATFLYRIDNNGNLTKLDKYESMPGETDDQNRKNFSSSSYMDSVCFTDSGFVTVEVVNTSWFEGDGDPVLYSDEYWAGQKNEQKYYVRSFDKDGNELTCALIPTEQDQWLNTYNMQLDKDGNVVFADSNTNSIRAVKLDGTDAYTVSAGADDYIDTVLRFADGSLAASIYGDDGQRSIGSTPRAALSKTPSALTSIPIAQSPAAGIMTSITPTAPTSMATPLRSSSPRRSSTGSTAMSTAPMSTF